MSTTLKEKLWKELEKWSISLVDTNGSDEGGFFIEKEEDRENYTAELRLSYTRKLNQNLPGELSTFLEHPGEDEGCLDYEELITSRIRQCFIRGVAGVGKTSLIEYIALKWAKGELFNDDKGDARFDFLFVIKCRELDEKDKETIGEFFARKFDVNVNELRNNGEKVLLIIDGLDEDADLQKSLQGNSKLRELMLENGSFLKGHATLATGRPHIESIIDALKKVIGEYKRIEVTGLSAKEVHKQIDRIANNNEMTASKIKQKVESSACMRALAAIPQYLKTLCYVTTIQGKSSDVEDTMTSLYIWTLYSFWTQHVNDKGNYERNGVYDCFNDPETKAFIRVLSNISYELLKQDKIIFKHKDFPEIAKLAAKNPAMFNTFFVKKKTHLQPLYQFKHLTMHEFFAATHCFLTKIPAEVVLERKFYEVARFIGGFIAAEESDDDESITTGYINCLKDANADECKKGKAVSYFNSVLNCLQRLKVQGEFAQHFALGLFREMFKGGENLHDASVHTIPRFQCVVGDPAFVYYDMTQIQLDVLVHFIKLMKENNLLNKLNETTLRIRFSDLTQHSYYGDGDNALNDLFKTFLSFKNVWFTYCESNSFPWMKMVEVKCPTQSKLDHLYINRCFMTEEDTIQLVKIIPFAARVELIDITLRDDVLEKLLVAIKEEQNQKRARLTELKMNYCRIKSDFKKKFMSLKGVETKIIK
eukprot:gene1185-556_t